MAHPLCAQTFHDGFFFAFGPEAVDNEKFKFHDVGDFVVKGKFKHEGRKVTGTLKFDDGSCATDGALDWTAKRRR